MSDFKIKVESVEGKTVHFPDQEVPTGIGTSEGGYRAFFGSIPGPVVDNPIQAYLALAVLIVDMLKAASEEFKASPQGQAAIQAASVKEAESEMRSGATIN